MCVVCVCRVCVVYVCRVCVCRVCVVGVCRGCGCGCMGVGVGGFHARLWQLACSIFLIAKSFGADPQGTLHTQHAQDRRGKKEKKP